MKNQHEDFKVADFSERVVAFSIDLALFGGLAYLSLGLLFRSFTIWANPHEEQWLALWSALFLIYQAYFSSEGRASLGKRLVGLRVTDMEGDALTLGQSMIRSALYLVSSIFELGFAWALFNPARQCWHDMAVGSVVVSTRERRGAGLALLRGLSALCLALFAGIGYWHYVARPRYHRLMDVGYAKVGAREVSLLQQLHFLERGRYANSLEELAPLSGQPTIFLADMNKLFDSKLGVKIKPSAKGYTFQARANDDNRTLIAFAGP
jgi:uncharacterized RDD family membrane protein YckC